MGKSGISMDGLGLDSRSSHGLFSPLMEMSGLAGDVKKGS